ncbi:hypothetical protein FB446DRAFT_734760 [Lentinula raphanica]|nr:hypothetical protein FB446DRAFT_734760 [Lentinula raphanica]
MDGDYLSQSSYQTAVYLRIASLTIALHEYVQTIVQVCGYVSENTPSDLVTRLTPVLRISFVLFLLIQFTSIATLVLSNVGYFYTHFTEHSCSHYYLIPSIFKVIQSTVSQTILGFRAFNLSRRSRMIGISLLALSIATTALEGLTNLYHRTPVIDPQYGNCRGVFQIEHTGFGEWIYYVVAIIYDLATSTVCMIYLHNYKTASNSLMFYDGIGYFTALTCVNITNLIIYRASQDTQCASLGYCMTWIMSKRLIIHLHEVSMQRRNDDTVADSEITSDEQTASSEFNTDEIAEPQAKVRTAAASLELTIPDFDLDDVDDGDDWSENGSIQRVRVEKTVQIERRPRNVYEFEDDMGYNRV